jgi:hypothetical protein
VVLVACLVPWPGLGRAYVSAFSRIGTTVVAPMLASATVEISFEPSTPEDEHHEWHTFVWVKDAQTHAPAHRGAVDLRRSGYLQIAILLALAAAFPLGRRVRWAAAVVAGTLLLGMLGWLPVLVYLALKGVIHLGSVAYATLAIAQRSLVGAPGMAFVVPSILWWLMVRWVDWIRPSSGARALVARLATRWGLHLGASAIVLPATSVPSKFVLETAATWSVGAGWECLPSNEGRPVPAGLSSLVEIRDVLPRSTSVYSFSGGDGRTNRFDMESSIPWNPDEANFRRRGGKEWFLSSAHAFGQMSAMPRVEPILEEPGFIFAQLHPGVVR